MPTYEFLNTPEETKKERYQKQSKGEERKMVNPKKEKTENTSE